MPSWPENVPFFTSTTGTRTETASNVIRSQMDMGPAKTRRRSTVSIPVIEGETEPMDAIAATNLRAFYRDILADGILKFSRADPYTGETRNFKFVGGFRERSNGPRFIFSATLEIVP